MYWKTAVCGGWCRHDHFARFTHINSFLQACLLMQWETLHFALFKELLGDYVGVATFPDLLVINFFGRHGRPSLSSLYMHLYIYLYLYIWETDNVLRAHWCQRGRRHWSDTTESPCGAQGFFLLQLQLSVDELCLSASATRTHGSRGPSTNTSYNGSHNLWHTLGMAWKLHVLVTETAHVWQWHGCHTAQQFGSLSCSYLAHYGHHCQVVFPTRILALPLPVVLPITADPWGSSFRSWLVKMLDTVMQTALMADICWAEYIV